MHYKKTSKLFNIFFIAETYSVRTDAVARAVTGKFFNDFQYPLFWNLNKQVFNENLKIYSSEHTRMKVAVLHLDSVVTG